MEGSMRLVCFALIVGLSPHMAGAQSAQPDPGARVRLVKTSGVFQPHRTGKVLSRQGDSVTVAFERTESGLAAYMATVPTAALEVSTGLRERVFEQGAVGAAIGGVVGALLGHAADQECEAANYCAANSSEILWRGLIAGGAVGGIIGGFSGQKNKTDRWVPATTARVDVMVGSRSVATVVAIRW
jgi:hypothetical protein